MWPKNLDTLKQSRRRLQMEHLLLKLIWLGVALAFLAALLNPLAALYPALAPWQLPISLGLAVAYLVWVYLSFPGTLTLARQLDQRLDSLERIQTLVEFSGQEGDMLKRLAQESAAHFQKHPPRLGFDRGKFLRTLPVAFLALALFLSTLYVSPALSQGTHDRRELADKRDEAVDIIEDILEELPNHPLLEELRQELADLKDFIQEARRTEDVDVLLREAQEALEKAREQLANTQDILDRLRELLEQGEGQAGAGQLLEELESLLGQLPQSMSGELQAIQEIIDQIEADGLDSADLERLREALAGLDPGEALTGAQRAGGEMARRMGQQGNGGNPGDGQGDPGDGSGDGSGSGDGNGSGDGSGDDSGSGDGSGNGSGSGDGSGDGNGSGDGSGSGNGSGNGAGGSPSGGAGTGGASPVDHDFFFIPGDGQVQLGGEGADGQYTLRDIIRFNPSLPTDIYSGYYNQYQRDALTSLQRGSIPGPLESYIRDYFQAIRPQQRGN